MTIVFISDGYDELNILFSQIRLFIPSSKMFGPTLGLLVLR